jgi:hypothetical protein
LRYEWKAALRVIGAIAVARVLAAAGIDGDVCRAKGAAARACDISFMRGSFEPFARASCDTWLRKMTERRSAIFGSIDAWTLSMPIARTLEIRIDVSSD